ncbi:hypothetical protein K491DRAFT_97353 [Lophiostoma macrostomum CBS 122681]|uniref:Uncharacterized protein n=1 Tax=Lophiostoma macrostomum CBS 122681 TaxID=1314788 RepID=A0A6A6TJP4_9PLEO|nr:hypothetical protein K491DRAFT_97353 [Lophiostoma macrostomum CBS 122681]
MEYRYTRLTRLVYICRPRNQFAVQSKQTEEACMHAPRGSIRRSRLESRDYDGRGIYTKQEHTRSPGSRAEETEGTRLAAGAMMPLRKPVLEGAARRAWRSEPSRACATWTPLPSGFRKGVACSFGGGVRVHVDGVLGRQRSLAGTDPGEPLIPRRDGSPAS